MRVNHGPIWLMQHYSITFWYVDVIVDMSQGHQSILPFGTKNLNNKIPIPQYHFISHPLLPIKQSSADFSHFHIYVGVNELFLVFGIVDYLFISYFLIDFHRSSFTFNIHMLQSSQAHSSFCYMQALQSGVVPFSSSFLVSLQCGKPQKTWFFRHFSARFVLHIIALILIYIHLGSVFTLVDNQKLL